MLLYSALSMLDIVLYKYYYYHRALFLYLGQKSPGMTSER